MPNRVVAIWLLVVAGFARGHAQSFSAANLRDEQELIKLEAAWAEGFIAGDTAFFQRTLAQDFIAVGGDSINDKRDVLAELNAPALHDSSTTVVGQPTIRHYGSAWLITGFFGSDGKSRGAFTEVWTKERGRWQARLGHYNMLPHATANAEQEVREASRRFVDAFNAGQWPIETNDSGAVFVSGAFARPIVAPDTTEKMRPHVLAEKRKNQKLTQTIRRVAVSDAGDMAWEYNDFESEYDATSTGRHIKFEGSTLRVWHKVAGEWKIAATFSRPNGQDE